MRRMILLLFLATCGCAGDDDDDDADPPTVVLLSPEGDVRVRENLAVAGRATGDLRRVSVRLDLQAPVEATGLEEWFHLLDVTSLPDGSHTVSAIAEDARDRVAESLPVSFTSVANQPPDTAIWSGLVRDAEQLPVPGATVTVFQSARATTTDRNGRYAMVGLDPDDGEALLVAGAPGFLDTYMPRFLPTDDANLDIPLFTTGTVAFLADQYGVRPQPGLGTVIGFILEALPSDEGYAGATVALENTTGDGPFYTTATGGFDPDLTETTSSGVFLFFNVASGPVAVVASDGGASFTLLDSEVVGSSLTLLFGREL